MSQRQYVSSGTPWEAMVGYARAVRVGPLISVAGTTAVDAQGQLVSPGDAYAQTVFILQKIEQALHELGASLKDTVRTRIYVTDIDRWQAIGQAHHTFFGAIRPASTMVQIARLVDPAMLVEIELEAWVEP
ncbi:MAG: RidA family protein [Chloroflexaceae bacterium]|nr:RidA family protein [Chloroflexaceae bacterium]